MDARIGMFLKSLWMRVVLHGVHYREKSGRLNALYCVEDPWGMGTTRELHRFKETNRFITEKIGAVKTLLEIGCGEGHQSRELLGVCEKLYGIDVSPRAIMRAKQRCPQATFVVGDLFSVPTVGQDSQFDLVVACEVLYYMRDIPTVLERMSKLGVACLVTYYEEQGQMLDPFLTPISEAKSANIEFNNNRWKVVWWHGKSVTRPGGRVRRGS
jgi:SAM-dependent methyltransferase